MTLPTILIIFLATISIIFSLRLSEYSKTRVSELLSFLRLFQPLWPIATGIFFALIILTSLYSAIGFLAGIFIFIAGSFVEQKINSEKTNSALFTLFAISLSVLGLSIMRLITLDVAMLITLFAGALLLAWYKKVEFINSELLRSLLFASIGVLGAHYFYAGSERAAHFILLLIVLGCAGMLLSIFAATHYGQSKPKQMFHVAAISYLLIASAAAGWIIPFRPINIAICILFGVVGAVVCVRNNKIWARNALLVAIMLSGYFVAEFYGAIIAFISFSALIPSTSLLPNTKTHIKIVTDFLFLLLIPIFIHGIATSGKSILFEIGNPFLLSGILLSLLVIWGYQSFMSHPNYSDKRSWLIIPAPLFLGLASVILFKENNGVILLTGVFVGLILQELLLSRQDAEDPGHKNLTLLFFISLFLFTNFLFS